MDNEIELISDGDGLAVIGNPTDVERSCPLRDCRRRTSDCPASELSSVPGRQLRKQVRRLRPTRVAG